MNYPVLRQTALAKAQRIVPYLTPSEVHTLSETALDGRQGVRDSLLVILLFQTGLRISEALSLTPSSIQRFEGKPVLSVIGKGRKLRFVACPQPLVDKLKSYAFDCKIEPRDPFFPIKRSRAWQIIKAISLKAGFTKKVHPHLFRHSDAIERLKQTGNPKALQIHLGHSSMSMTMRYLSTLTAEDAIRVQQDVQFD
jgi:site-specific recombinase XerD